MLTCLPLSFCSRNYRVLNTGVGEATLTFNLFSEQGAMTIGPNTFDIRKHGPLSGRWTVEAASENLATAVKPSALFRRFEISAGDFAFTLTAASAFTRNFLLVHEGQTVGTIRPVHAFTRRATIDAQEVIPIHLQLFAFWLVVVTWHRAQKNND